jgi:hypothetical protein
MSNGMVHLDHWKTLDGHVEIDWQEGPYAHEVAIALMELVADQEVSALLEAADISGVSYNSLAPESSAQLVVRGVRVRLRPLNPLGHEEAARRVFARITAEAQQVTTA